MRMVFQVAGGILLAGLVVLVIGVAVVVVGRMPAPIGPIPVPTPVTRQAGPSVADEARAIAAGCGISVQGVEADAAYADQLGITLGTPPDTGAMYAWVATNLPAKPSWETCGQLFESFANPKYTPAPLPLAVRRGDGGR